MSINRSAAVASVILWALVLSTPLCAQRLSGTALLEALRGGGYVILMRHASSPGTPPDAATASPGNTTMERQLDETGRRSATAMGEAFATLKIPVGQVLSSPTYRALETVRYAKLPAPTILPELGDGGRGMAAAGAAPSTWLRQRVLQFPTGTNTVIVSHSPNIMAAFPAYAGGLADGEALVLGPDGRGGVALMARVRVGEWLGLGARP